MWSIVISKFDAFKQTMVENFSTPDSATTQHHMGSPDHFRSCPYTSLQNKMKEHRLQTLLLSASCLLTKSKHPSEFSVEAILTLVYTLNRLIAQFSTKVRITIWVLYKHPLDYKNLKAFGCLCFSLILPIKTKLDNRFVECIFLDYYSHQKGYKYMNFAT